jgi:hypothetical protein
VTAALILYLILCFFVVLHRRARYIVQCTIYWCNVSTVPFENYRFECVCFITRTFNFFFFQTRLGAYIDQGNLKRRKMIDLMQIFN